MSNRLTYISAGILFLTMLCLAFFSVIGDSLTGDELAHIPAGYYYLTQKDYRINPEHPPLIKDLAALPLLFVKNINFLSGIKSWQDGVDNQWIFGYNFFYQSGNPTDQMIFWARVPMIFILLLLGFYVFRWTRELFGNNASLLSLFLFSFSPTFLAHGRLVTTDVGAATGIFIATYYFIKTLKNPTKRNVVLAGISLGLGELCKFSVILLVPLFIFLGFLYWFIKIRRLKEALKILLSVFFIGYLLVGLIYQYHVWNYPEERQARDTKILLEDYPAFIKDPLVTMAQTPILRPYAQYLTGLFMSLKKASSEHTTYFFFQSKPA